MKKGWTYKKLEACIDKVPKQKQVKSKDYQSSGKYPIVSQEKELVSGYWDDESYLYKHIKPVIIFGDHTKEIKFIDFDFVVGADGTQILSPKEGVDAKFFYYALLATPIRSLGYARHFKLLKEKSFLIPHFSEQLSIVSRLDTAFAQIDALKANAEKQLAEARALFQKALEEAMRPKEGWEEMKLGEFAYMKAGNFVKASEIKTEYEEGLYPCYGGNGFRGYVNEPNQEGDFCLIGRQGALCGCINRASGIFRTTEHAVIVKPYKPIPTSLVYHLLVNLDLNKYATGAAQPGLSVNHIAEVVRIGVPPEEQWDLISSHLDSLSAKVRELEEVQRKTMAECDALKQALLREVFE